MWDAAVGGFFNLLGTQATNKSNRGIAIKQMDFQQGTLEQQMDFQERMSSTAYQRSMADMREAGLNPILAGNYGNNSPTGSTAPGAGIPMQNELGAAVEGMLAGQQIANAKEQEKVLDATHKNITAQTKKTGAETQLLEGKVPRAQFKENFLGDVYKGAGDLWNYLKNQGSSAVEQMNKNSKPLVIDINKSARDYKNGKPIK